MKVTRQHNVLEAHQWFENGDFKGEVTEVFKDGTYVGEFYEGSVVRYFRHPNIPGENICPICQQSMHVHGWIDQGEDGTTVCPGDYVVKLSPVEYIVHKPEEFFKLYHTVDTNKPLVDITFQERVWTWLELCFKEQFPELINDAKERQHRFIEESLELVQTLGLSKQEVLSLVEYVYQRPVGAIEHEAGGTCTTLAVLLKSLDIDMNAIAEKELKRNYEIIDRIREKQYSKNQLNIKTVSAVVEQDDTVGR